MGTRVVETENTTVRLVASLVDLTTLEATDTPESVAALCATALRPCAGRLPAVAAVCVYPMLVTAARATLDGSSVRVASVAGAFPSGQSTLDVRLADVGSAVSAGADEIDMVISRGAFLSGRIETVSEEVRRIRETCTSAGAAEGRTVTLKVILETGELETDANIRRACDLVIEAARPRDEGALFLKTSTGKIAAGATLSATRVMAEAIRDHHAATGVPVGLKVAGGIATRANALEYVALVQEVLGSAWLTPTRLRFGASRLLGDLCRALVGDDA